MGNSDTSHSIRGTNRIRMRTCFTQFMNPAFQRCFAPGRLHASPHDFTIGLSRPAEAVWGETRGTWFMSDGHSNLAEIRMRWTVQNFQFYGGQISLQRRWASRRPAHSKWTETKKRGEGHFGCLLGRRLGPPNLLEVFRRLTTEIEGWKKGHVGYANYVDIIMTIQSR